MYQNYRQISKIIYLKNIIFYMLLTPTDSK